MSVMILDKQDLRVKVSIFHYDKQHKAQLLEYCFASSEKMPSLVYIDLVLIEQKAQNSDPFKEERITDIERLEIDRVREIEKDNKEQKSSKPRRNSR